MYLTSEPKLPDVNAIVYPKIKLKSKANCINAVFLSFFVLHFLIDNIMRYKKNVDSSALISISGFLTSYKKGRIKDIESADGIADIYPKRVPS